MQSEKNIRRLSEEAILDFLHKSGKPESPKYMIESIKENPILKERIIREVIWLLIGRAEINFTADRKLEIKSTSLNNGLMYV